MGCIQQPSCVDALPTNCSFFSCSYFKIYSFYLILHISYFTLHTLYFILYTLHFTLYTSYFILRTLYFILSLYTLYLILYTLYFILYTLYFILYTLNFILYTDAYSYPFLLYVFSYTCLYFCPSVLLQFFVLIFGLLSTSTLLYCFQLCSCHFNSFTQVSTPSPLSIAQKTWQMLCHSTAVFRHTTAVYSFCS